MSTHSTHRTVRLRALTSPRIAIAQEWLAVHAGSEKTFEAMAEAFPEADVYALAFLPGIPFDFGGRPVHTTFLNRRRRFDTGAS